HLKHQFIRVAVINDVFDASTVFTICPRRPLQTLRPLLTLRSLWTLWPLRTHKVSFQIPSTIFVLKQVTGIRVKPHVARLSIRRCRVPRFNPESHFSCTSSPAASNFNFNCV